MFSKHYQEELAFLRDAGKAYAEANPATAGLLAERGGDPDVERLLEGFAFLAARIRERIDDAVPEVVHDLAELLLPHYLRPVPAATIVEMTPIPGALRARTRVPAGSELASLPVEGTACRFRTSADLELVPATVQDVTLDQAVAGGPVLRVQLQSFPQAQASLFQPDGLRFYLHGEFPLASTLLLWLGRHLRGVRVSSAAAPQGVDLPRAAVALVGRELPLLPWPPLAPQGYRTLQEYFTLPQKLLFFDVRSLHLARAAAADRFELAFQFARPPDLPTRVGRDTVRLNCVPAVNLFRASADPVSVQAGGEGHLLRAAEVRPHHMEIYEVESVVGVPEEGGGRTTYLPYTAFRHGQRGQEARYYRLRRALSPVDGGLDTFISLARPLDAGTAGGREVLSADVVATNRTLPARIKLGELSQATGTSPTQARFRNIVAVSQPVRPPLGTELQWRFVAHLAANRASITTTAGLRTLIALYNLQLLADQQVGRANALRIESVREVGATSTLRLVGGAPARGTRVTLTLDEGGFAGMGDAFLFASAVEDLLAAQASLSSFVHVVARLEPSQREYAWVPRNGQKALL